MSADGAMTVRLGRERDPRGTSQSDLTQCEDRDRPDSRGLVRVAGEDRVAPGLLVEDPIT
jgi:hypothetical protein